jgi:hypothetical protein
MAGYIRIDVQEGQSQFVLVNLIGGDFAFDDLGENTVGHLILRMGWLLNRTSRI